MRAIAHIIGLLISLPIWFFLLYRILDSINASELTWFLYWVYVPSTVLGSVLIRLISGEK